MPDIRTVNSLAEYVTEVGKIRAELENREALEPHQELWFRGEPSDYGDTKLSPKLFRPVSTRAPIDVGRLLDIDSDLFDEFCRRGVEMQYVPPDGGEEDWTWYYMMQHYGAPTRLLDWSDGSLMALHFAVNGAVQPEAPRVYVLNSYSLDLELESSKDAATARDAWDAAMLDPTFSRLTPDDWYRIYLPTPNKQRSQDNLQLPASPLIDDPETVTRRFAAQRSRFILFGKDTQWLRKRHDMRDSPIVEVCVHAKCVPNIRKELRDAGVTESVIFPDLDGLGREMVHIWEARR